MVLFRLFHGDDPSPHQPGCEPLSSKVRRGLEALREGSAILVHSREYQSSPLFTHDQFLFFPPSVTF